MMEEWDFFQSESVGINQTDRLTGSWRALEKPLSASRGSTLLLSFMLSCSSRQSCRQRASLARLTIYWAPRLACAVWWPAWGSEHAQGDTRECSCVKESGPSSYLVLLQLQFLHVVELLRLQLAHPVVQLVDLVPAGNTSHVIVGADSFGPFQKCWRTSVCLRSGGRCSGVCVWQPESSSSSLSQSLSSLLSSGQPDLTDMEDRIRVPSPLTCKRLRCHVWCVSSLRPGWNKSRQAVHYSCYRLISWAMPVVCVVGTHSLQVAAVAGAHAGQSWLLLSFIFCLLLGVGLLSDPPLLLFTKSQPSETSLHD